MNELNHFLEAGSSGITIKNYNMQGLVEATVQDLVCRVFHNTSHPSRSLQIVSSQLLHTVFEELGPNTDFHHSGLPQNKTRHRNTTPIE